MPAIQLIRTISDVDQKYYPETLNKLFVVNAPSAFVYVWKIVKGWLDRGTIEKIQILGSDYQEKLLEQIPAENLPSFLGGICECDLPGSCVPSQSKVYYFYYKYISIDFILIHDFFPFFFFSSKKCSITSSKRRK